MRSLPSKPIVKPTGWNAVEFVSLAAFLIWSAAGLLFTFTRITPDVIAHWPVPDSVGRFINGCIQTGDPILILLAFINTHLHAVRQWSAGVARRWGAIVLVFAFGIETIGTLTSLPFGSYHYTDTFGPMLGVVPLTIPLAWHVVVTNVLFVLRAVAPHLSRLGEAVLTGFFCTLYDSVLEPFATIVKHYWIWTEGSIPPLNYVAWFLLSALLVRLCAPTISSQHRLDPRPVLILGITILIFLAGEF